MSEAAAEALAAQVDAAKLRSELDAATKAHAAKVLQLRDEVGEPLFCIALQLVVGMARFALGTWVQGSSAVSAPSLHGPGAHRHCRQVHRPLLSCALPPQMEEIYRSRSSLQEQLEAALAQCDGFAGTARDLGTALSAQQGEVEGARQAVSRGSGLSSFSASAGLMRGSLRRHAQLLVEGLLYGIPA